MVISDVFRIYWDIKVATYHIMGPLGRSNGQVSSKRKAY